MSVRQLAPSDKSQLESATKLRLYLRPLSAWGCDSNLESRRPLMQPNHRNRPPIMNSTA